MLAFIDVEAVADAAVTTILRRSFGWGHCDLASWRQYRDESPVSCATDLKRALQFYPALESVSGPLVVPYCGYERLRPDIRYFTLLREPLERCASHYLQQTRAKQQNIPPFLQWIQQEQCRNGMTKKLAGTGNSDDAIQMLETRIGCTGLAERLDESLLLFRRWANHPRLDIRYGKPAAPPPGSLSQQLHADSASRQALIDANLEDLRLYLYVANELFPRQLAGYGSGLAADLEEFRAANHALPFTPRDVASLVYRLAVYHRAAQLRSTIRRAA